MMQQPAPTQYILATNQQGQTYVVAQHQQQTHQIPQTVLMAQTPQQMGTQTKTIIILQQQPGQQQMGQQKIIMTPQGEFLLILFCSEICFVDDFISNKINLRLRQKYFRIKLNWPKQ